MKTLPLVVTLPSFGMYERCVFFAIVGCLVLSLGIKTFQPEKIFLSSRHDLTTVLVAATVLFSISIYAFNFLLSSGRLLSSTNELILYMGATGFLGPLFEVGVNSTSVLIVGSPIWLYQIMPVHEGYSSVVMLVFWPLYGLHLYFFHQVLERTSMDGLMISSLLIGFDAVILEILINSFFISTFGTYLFFYFPGDLGHLSTAAIFIPYVICGVIGISLIRLLKNSILKLWFGVYGFICAGLLLLVLPLYM